MRFVFLCKEKPPTVGKKVAIIGAGPAGLAATGYLACKGYDIDVYDKLPLPGGLMIFAIPPWRIPREVVLEGAKELEKEFSVKFFLKTKVYYGEKRHDEGDEFIEKTISFEEILGNYDAILITTGTWRSRIPRIPGKDAEGVVSALEFLYKHRLKELGYIDKIPYHGKRVIVVGGGYSAVDAAEQALADGYEEVYLVYRRTIREAPAGIYEIERIRRMGVNVIELASPVEIIAENNIVKSVKFQKMRLGPPDESGRPKPIPVPGSEFTLDADIVVFATGETPTPPFSDQEVMTKFNIKIEKHGNIAVDGYYRTGNPKVFAAGDVVHGPSKIGPAIGSGLKAARFMDRILRAKAGELVIST